MEIEYSKQINKLFLSSRVVGDLTYKKEVNWESNKADKRERANVMFSRIEDALYFLAYCGTLDDKDFSVEDDNIYEFTDGFGYIIYKCFYDSNLVLYIYVEDIVFTYKQDKDSWWAIVDKKRDVRYPFLTRILDY